MVGRSNPNGARSSRLHGQHNSHLLERQWRFDSQSQGARQSSHQRPLAGQKTEVFEGGHRAPLLIRWPGRVQPASKSDQLVALTDLLATTADLLGTSLPENAGEDSFSFLHALEETDPKGRVRESCVHDSNGGLFAIRAGKWKLILGQGGGGLGWNPQDHDSKEPAGQLFNLDEDLGESNNLYEEHPEIVARLRQQLSRIRENADGK